MCRKGFIDFTHSTLSCRSVWEKQSFAGNGKAHSVCHRLLPAKSASPFLAWFPYAVLHASLVKPHSASRTSAPAAPRLEMRSLGIFDERDRGGRHGSFAQANDVPFGAYPRRIKQRQDLTAFEFCRAPPKPAVSGAA